jgi:hypothetical protein
MGQLKYFITYDNKYNSKYDFRRGQQGQLPPPPPIMIVMDNYAVKK